MYVCVHVILNTTYIQLEDFLYYMWLHSVACAICKICAVTTRYSKCSKLFELLFKEHRTFAFPRLHRNLVQCHVAIAPSILVFKSDLFKGKHTSFRVCMRACVSACVCDCVCVCACVHVYACGRVCV